MSTPFNEQYDNSAIFYIGQHEWRRNYPVTDDLVRYAQETCNYDMLTAPITNDAFNSKILSLLSPFLDSPGSPTNQASFPNFPSVPFLTPLDTSLVPSSNVGQLVLTTSSWIDLTSPDPLIADVSRQILQLEVQYAAFCGATNLIIYGPPTVNGRCPPEGLSQYARAIMEALRAGLYLQIHILLPMTGSENSAVYKDVGDLSQYARSNFSWKLVSQDGSTEDRFNSWDVWNAIRSVCKYNVRLSVALLIPHELPPISVQTRWYSEPLRLLHISARSFQQNIHGEVFLPSPHRQLLEHYMRLRTTPWILLSDVGSLHVQPSGSLDATAIGTANDPTPSEAAEMATKKVSNNPIPGSHLRYLRDMQLQLPPKRPIERFGAGYQDYLQHPLQPLSDNLESITYEVFEKDPVKYEWYERAIIAALSDWKAKAKPASGLNDRIVLAVVGAGRGPLVTRALNASAKSGIAIDLWALEKNQNAFVLLQQHNRDQWNNQVNLAQADMRTWTGPFHFQDLSNHQENSKNRSQSAVTTSKRHYSIDILVSELLGSFADNELSPECLDGVQHLLNPKYGISIPMSYTAHLTPVAAPKIHADILARAAAGDAEAGQTPYVVLLQAIDILPTRLTSRTPSSTKNKSHQHPRTIPLPVIQQAWKFSHPSIASPPSQETFPNNQHNRRFARLDFHCKDKGTCHGLAGYFETVLYDSGSANPLQQDVTSPSQASHKVELSTNPLTMDLKSKDMISWFPIFFPLKVPLYFPDNSLLSVSMWRQTDGRKVWYEWLVESFMLLDIAADGSQKVERLAVTDLHSSVATGCLL